MGAGRESNPCMTGAGMLSLAATASLRKTGGCHGEEKEMCFTGHHGRWLVSLRGPLSLDASKYLANCLGTFQAHHFVPLKGYAI